MIQEPSLRDLSPQGLFQAEYPDLCEWMGSDNLNAVATYLAAYSPSKVATAVRISGRMHGHPLRGSSSPFNIELFRTRIGGDAVEPQQLTAGYRIESK